MTNRELAKVLLDYIPFWEMPFVEKKENYKSILENIKEDPQSMYDFLYDENDNSETYCTIINELKRRIKKNEKT